MADARRDVIVIGAGHNGLAAACTLARGGASVLVLERADRAGGLCVGDEFHPGCVAPGLLHDTACLRPGVVDALQLERHGLEWVEAPPVFSPQIDGPGLVLHGAPGAAAAEIAAHSARDVAAYTKFRDFIARVRRVVEPVLNDVPPDMMSITSGGLMSMAKYGLALRAMGSHDMMEVLRIPPMCVADWTREFFETELLCASLSQLAVSGTWCGPWSPGTASNLLLRECTAGRAVRGGAPALIDALSRAAASAGVEVRTGAAVEEIRVEKGAARGVTLAGGEAIDAGVVLSSADPRTTFLRLVHPRHIADHFARNLEAWRARGTTAKVNLALDRPLEFACRPGLRPGYARTAQTLDGIERAFDAVKYRRASEHPVLDIFVPAAADPAAESGSHEVVSIVAHYAPYGLEGGWTDAAREALGDSVLAELERFAPGVSGSVVAREVLTPRDIEERYGTTGGHVHHGEHALDQLITRPTPETARYASPIKGLYICGSGSHPGGGITCAPGSLGARRARTG